MKISLLVIVSSIAAHAYAVTCGGGAIKGQDVNDLIVALIKIGKDGQMVGNVLRNCRGKMCVACWDYDLTETGLRQTCPEAAAQVAPDVGDGASTWCDYPGLKNLNMFNYYKK
ncbi:hypothetical protein BGZ99_000838 [Dissophora globulifera]|uniref:Uncharacterized protein n=1 Tax=Dissophora globulifera TaxID=979702 RepID=A0A9P6R421_9FUNG|nr:hypothetical protein BGZ99_000838 [Dissophora globulifera]